MSPMSPDSSGRGYGATTRLHLGLYAAGHLCTAFLVPPVISRGAPRQATWEISISDERNYGREMAGQFGMRFRLPRNSQGSFTYSKYATWDRRLYFPSERRHDVDFFARKIRRLRQGSKPRSDSSGTKYTFHKSFMSSEVLTMQINKPKIQFSQQMHSYF
jgi:hypothetical protein